MKIIFTNKRYPILLFSMLILVVIIQLINLFYELNEISVFFLILSLSTIASILFHEQGVARILIKICSGLAIFGGFLGILSVVMFCLIGKFEENVTISEILRHSLHFVIGLFLFLFLDKSISKKE